MFGRHKGTPGAPLRTLPAGERMVGHTKAVAGAHVLLRASAARHAPGEPIIGHVVHLSRTAINQADVARLICDVRHYAQMTGMDWRAILAEAESFWNDEAPPTPAPKHGSHRR